MKEGLHLDGNGLRLLMRLDQLAREIDNLERTGRGQSKRCAMLKAHRDRAACEAESHCRQAGIPWEKFQGVLEKGTA